MSIARLINVPQELEFKDLDEENRCHVPQTYKNVNFLEFVCF